MNQKNSSDIPQFGYFLDYHRHWLQALDLLKYQLETKKGNIKKKKRNRHFNTLEMFYYEKFEKFFGILENEDYFKTRIVNNLFYGLKEFAVVPYTIPKSNLGLRRYNFMTCPMRVLYYAVGLYLLELSQEYLKDYKSNDHIHANYGGNLCFEGDQLNLKLDSIFYKNHYTEFRERLKRKIRSNTERKAVIYFDIENYFDELSIPKLLDLLEKRVKPSIQKRMRYDATTQAQLISFFNFVVGRTSGIPQSDNNVMSDFIGYLFLVFGDLFLDDELRKNNDSVENYAIIRYVDDMHISITFREQDNNLRDRFLNSLTPRISDCFYENLGLRLNPKTKLFDIEKEDDRNELESNLKKVSQGIEIADEENKESSDKKVDNIFGELDNLKGSSIDPHFQRHRDLDKEILKEIYDESVQRKLKKPNNKDRLKQIFIGSGGFDFELVNAYPLPIIILILVRDDIRKKFEEFLLSKKDLTSRDIYLILTYLCQIECDRTKLKLLKLLKQSPRMKEVMEIFEDSLPPKLIGYYDLRAEEVSKIVEPNVTEQIRLRVLWEQKEEYSVALNHLLNEIHAICGILDGEAKSEKRYEANQVAAFLRKQEIPHETYAQIRNLFDRRNKSLVSHADPIAWAVTKDEYMNYRSHVGDCLKHLEQAIEDFQPPAWEEVKQHYTKKLEPIPCVQKGYIKIDGNNAKVVIVLAEESVEIIEELDEIDREINLKFHPRYFFMEYEPSEDYLELGGFECFYKAGS